MTTATKKARSQSRKLPVVAGARLSKDEMAELRAVAQADGQSVSNFLRLLVLREIRPTA